MAPDPVLVRAARQKELPAPLHSPAAPPAAEPSWPVLAAQAMQGPLGDLVRLVAPHSEADPVAILAQALVGFGSIVGRGPHFVVEADEHHPNLFAAIVGDTAQGRKGSSWGQVRRVLALVDPDWAEGRVLAGLSSGEGLIWSVRDAIYKVDHDKKTGTTQEVVADPGVTDKRLLVVEGELASVLKVLRREGNTLSPLLRSAWDGGRLQSMTKNSPAVATGACVSLVGHVTSSELLRHLGETEGANGYANRHLWLLARRANVLPWGGSLHNENLAPLVHSLRAAVDHARTLGRVEPDVGARALWEAVYPALSTPKPGLLGAVTARGPAQTLRLALVYALADCSSTICAEHLGAALALWDYAEESARRIFGDQLGDATADAILSALREAPGGRMTRTDIYHLLGGHKRAAETGRALALLAGNGIATVEKQSTGGRPVEVWTLSTLSTLSTPPGVPS